MKRVLLFLFLFLQFSYAIFGQEQDSLNRHKTSFFKKNLLLPSAGIGLGLYSRIPNVPLNKYEVRAYRNTHFPGFENHIDDYLQFVPIAAAYGLELTNLESTNTLWHKTVGLGFSQAITLAIVYPLKYTVGDLRPDNSSYNAFPSGHTAEAFMAAQFLWKEYGKKYPVIGVLGYGFAATTGVFRILNGRHWSSDVLAGAGIGILSVNLGYLCLDWYKKHHTKGSFLRFH